VDEEDRELVVGAEVLVCPPPSPMLAAYVREAWEEHGGLSLEEVLSIAGFAERRGFRSAMEELERFLIQHPKF